MKIAIAASSLIAIGFLFVLIAAPSIWNDYKMEKMELTHSDTYEVARHRCRSRAFLFTECTVYVQEILGHSKTYFDYYLFGDMSNTSAYVLVAPETGEITTNIGVQNILNRILTIVGLFSFFLSFALYVVYNHHVRKKSLNNKASDIVRQ